MSNHQRPLSPHLQVYRPQLTSVMSILHRISGLANSFGALSLILWLVAAAAGPERYAGFTAFFGSFPGQVLLFLWTYSLFYHLCNGVRHLFWDAGKGFEIRHAYASGYAAIAVSVGLTLATWAAALLGGGS